MDAVYPVRVSDLVSSFMTGKLETNAVDHLRQKFPGGPLNSSRFPGFPGVVDTLRGYRYYRPYQPTPHSPVWNVLCGKLTIGSMLNSTV